jgi:nucleotide-binding universal stress UspA family protein
VLAAIDGSSVSRSVLQHAVRLCTGADDKLLILTVKEPRPAQPPNDSRAVVLAQNDDLFALMAELQEPIKTQWEKRDVVGDARTVILESSAGVDYVVIGARGVGSERINETLMPLGSTAQFVAQHSHAPVLIVKDTHRHAK